MSDQRRLPHAQERFTCGGCGETVQRRRPLRPTGKRCLCCSFLDTVHDVQTREALRGVLDRMKA
jgi:hypothetical protein